MLAGTRLTDDADIGLIFRNKKWYILDQAFGKIANFMGLQYLFYPSSFRLKYHAWFKEADIIQLYNTHGGYFSHLALPGISKRKPIVWRLSDMWPMTGHCAYSYDCERFKIGCGLCPYLSEYPSLKRDTTALLWKVKNWVYKRLNIIIVAPSKWIADLARQSPLTSRFKICIIPNGLDIQIFKPVKKEIARKALDIDLDKKVVFFSAHSVKDHRKGGVLLKEALSKLAKKNIQNVILLVAGSESESYANEFDFPVKHVNFISNDTMMVNMYSASDLFVLPTLADNLPNGIIESMACGTPVVSFNVGGVPDIIKHMKTGYLARYKDSDDLAEGIKILLEDNNLRNSLSNQCRKLIEQEYSSDLQAERFKSLYEDLLKNGK